LSGLETAIKQALERSDRASPETRARIYQSARNALEAGLRKQNIHDDTVIAQQRHRLEVAIHAIEQQERAMLRDEAEISVAEPPPENVRADLRAGGRRMAEPSFGPAHENERAGYSVEPDAMPSADISADERFDRHSDRSEAPPIDQVFGETRAERGTLSERAAPAPAVAPIRDAKRPGKRARDADNDFGLPGAEPLAPRRRRGRGGRLVSFLMVSAVLIAAIGSAIWWAMDTGLLDPPQNQSASSPTTIASDFDGSAGLRTLGPQAGFTSDWLDLYMPTGTGGVTPGARVRTETIRDEGGQRLRIVSAAGDASGSVAIEVPAATLERMSGKTSTIALSVQSSTGKPTQFSIECEFGSLGNCGRHRFTINDEKSDMLFKVMFDRTMTPSGPGRILVNSDVTANGGGLDLYAVRLLPGQ
jgi:hypothetical protein